MCAVKERWTGDAYYVPDLHAYQLDGAHTHTHICTRSHEGKLIFTLNALLTYASVFAVLAVVVVVFMFFICWCIFSAFLQNFNAVRRTCLSSCTSWLAQSSSAASTATTATPTITPQRLRCVASSIAPPPQTREWQPLFVCWLFDAIATRSYLWQTFLQVFRKLCISSLHFCLLNSLIFVHSLATASFSCNFFFVVQLGRRAAGS